MKLIDYLKVRGLTEEQFARKIGRSQAAINRYCKGRVPDTDTMPLIIEETAGAVQPNDFFAEHLPASKPKRKVQAS